jgi:anthranilate phosphoribosyltransferase
MNYYEPVKGNVECRISKNLARKIMNEILVEYSEKQSKYFLEYFIPKRLSEQELTGFYQGVMDNAIKIEFNFPTMDIVGTGGDGKNTINASTGAAIIAASLGVKVAKHGNYSISSKCGSANLMESLGYTFPKDKKEAEKQMEQTGFTFLLAPYFHPMFKKLKKAREEITKKAKIEGKSPLTLLNLLGPLCNPASSEYRLIGICDAYYGYPIAKTLRNIGIKSGIIVHGNGLDEFYTKSKTWFIEGDIVYDDKFSAKLIDNRFELPAIDTLLGGDKTQNAKEIMEILSGKLKGPKANFLALNATMAIGLTRRVRSIEGLKEIANEIYDHLNSGKAAVKLEQIIEASKSV